MSRYGAELIRSDEKRPWHNKKYMALSQKFRPSGPVIAELTVRSQTMAIHSCPQHQFSKVILSRTTPMAAFDWGSICTNFDIRLCG